MLTPEQLKPHILHEDRWIRRAVLDSLNESWSRDPEIAGLALAAHERYWKPGHFPNLNCLDQLPIDPPTLRRILALLDETPSPIVVVQINRCLVSLPLGVLRDEGSPIEDHPRLEEETREMIRFRRRLGGLSDAGLWDEFLEFSGRAKMRRVPHALDRVRCQGLTDELAARKMPDENELLAALRSPAFRGTFFDALLVRVAGARRLEAAVPCLVAQLVPDEDDDGPRPSFLCESIARIGDPDTVRLIRRRWWDLERGDAAGVLGSLSTPAAEEALLELFEDEDDERVRFFIVEALCRLFSAGAVGPVRAVLRGGPAWPAEELPERLLPVIDLLGIDVPEAGAWRKEREEKRARHRSPEGVRPEALEVHRKILGALEEMDRADAMREQAIEELQKGLAEPGAGEDEDREERD